MEHNLLVSCSYFVLVMSSYYLLVVPMLIASRQHGLVPVCLFFFMCVCSMCLGHVLHMPYLQQQQQKTRVNSSPWITINLILASVRCLAPTISPLCIYDSFMIMCSVCVSVRWGCHTWSASWYTTPPPSIQYQCSQYRVAQFIFIAHSSKKRWASLAWLYTAVNTSSGIPSYHM